eukprot:scaffold28338_cov38-Cyclotella_meneghiniana.AAC.2
MLGGMVAEGSDHMSFVSCTSWPAAVRKVKSSNMNGSASGPSQYSSSMTLYFVGESLHHSDFLGPTHLASSNHSISAGTRASGAEVTWVRYFVGYDVLVRCDVGHLEVDRIIKHESRVESPEGTTPGRVLCAPLNPRFGGCVVSFHQHVWMRVNRECIPIEDAPVNEKEEGCAIELPAAIRYTTKSVNWGSSPRRPEVMNRFGPMPGLLFALDGRWAMPSVSRRRTVPEISVAIPYGVRY